VIERSDDPGVIARTVALGVAGVAGVARLTPGAGGVEAATYYAGGRTIGVVVLKDQVAVHVVVSELPIARITERVREAAQRVLRAIGAERPVEVVVEDLEVEQLPRILPSTILPPLQARTPRVQ
jgi:hypothetical protein